MSEVYDLDVLIPQPVTIKINGAEVPVEPPKTADILRLGFLGQRLQGANDLSSEDLDKLIDELTAQLKKCIPAIQDTQINMPQMLKLIEILTQMATPPDTKELQERGITGNGSKKVQ